LVEVRRANIIPVFTKGKKPLGNYRLVGLSPVPQEVMGGNPPGKDWKSHEGQEGDDE